MALHVHAQEWIPHISKTSRKILTTKKRPQTQNLSTEYVCPKTLLNLAAGAEEEDVEQEDMAYTTGNLRVP
jgi:hypothetical protein